MISKVKGKKVDPDLGQTGFEVRGFHLDLRVQVMTLPALKRLARDLQEAGINTLVLEWEANYPFKSHPLIAGPLAYKVGEVHEFLAYCRRLGIDTIPLQQNFGHVEYILRHPRYQHLREDRKNYSQLCPLEAPKAKALFAELFAELAASHSSKYFHIGGDETYLLGHCARCRKKAQRYGKSKLYVDYVRQMAQLALGLGKTPLIWADMVLKHPEAIRSLPKKAVFVDWNYGWDLGRFGRHRALLKSGLELWGAPALRSDPDNYFLTRWDYHLKNLRDFVPAGRRLGYRGMIITSWSTSGEFSSVFESGTDIVDLIPIRRNYPLAGFGMLLAAFAESLRSARPIDPKAFVLGFAQRRYGLKPPQAAGFWEALSDAPYQVKQGVVDARPAMSLPVLLRRAQRAAQRLKALRPASHAAEFEHYRLMADIRVHYLGYQALESRSNSKDLAIATDRGILAGLRRLRAEGQGLSARFSRLHRGYLKPAELRQENALRNAKVQLLIERLAAREGR